MTRHEQAPLTFTPGSHCRKIAARCTCGWSGPGRRPEDHGGDVSPWVNDWRAHREQAAA